MAGNFRTELPTMAVASGHVFEVNEQVQAQLSALMGRLEPLMGTWQGDAASSFHVLKEQWNANARELNAALRGIGDALVVNTNNYRVRGHAKVPVDGRLRSPLVASGSPHLAFVVSARR